MENLEVFTKYAKGEQAVVIETTDCVIYTRVSSKEQMENMSLESQLKACNDYARKMHYNVLAHFGGTYETATTDERKEFKRMVEFCRRRKKGSIKIIVFSLERFSRTGDNAIWIARQLRGQRITIDSVTQPIDTSNPAGVLQQNILFLFSQYDNDLRKEKTVRGMKDHMEAGIWCCQAPLGYDNVTVNGEKSVVINETGKILRKAFLWKANEGITMVEIVKRLEAHGLTIKHNRLSAALSNPFYCGIISHSLLGGKVVEGKHEKLVSKDIFLKANMEKGKIPHGYKANPLNDNLPLKLYAKCEGCGENLRGYLVKKKNLYYYKCDGTGKCACNVSAKALHKKFETLLEEITLDEKYVELYKLQLRKIFTTLNEERAGNVEQYRAKIKELDTKAERLEERYINEEITPDLYRKYTDRFNSEREELRRFLEQTGYSASNLETYIENSLQYVMELPSMWASSDYVGKRKLQFRVFPEGFFYNKKNDQPRTTKMNSVFALIARLKGNTEENETGTSEIKFRNSGWVVPTGIEPVSKV
jgi:site-specific DNA recombinase